MTAYSNTWALGPLKPGAVATFDWAVTAVKAGAHVVNYRVAAGLNGKAKAQLADGQPPTGSFRVTIHNAPAQALRERPGQDRHAAAQVALAPGRPPADPGGRLGLDIWIMTAATEVFYSSAFMS